MNTYQNRLRQAGLRLTKQRLALGQLLFDAGDRHVTAEGFYDEARRAGIEVSLATIYNTLHQSHGDHIAIGDMANFVTYNGFNLITHVKLFC